MVRALEKRPVPSDALEQAIGRLVHRLRTMGEREVPSRLVGELVMEELHELDEVAYVRFASVYRQFEDVNEFLDELRVRSNVFLEILGCSINFCRNGWHVFPIWWR